MPVFNIDASSLKYLTCFRRYYNRFALGKGHGFPCINDVEYGSAWHKFRESLALTQDANHAMAEAAKYFATKQQEGMAIRDGKDHLNLGHLTGLMLKYIHEVGVTKTWNDFEYIINPVTNKPLVEQTFKLLIYSRDDYEFYLCGTMDELAENSRTKIALVGDDKTTSDFRIDGFLNNFELKPQLMVYMLALEILESQDSENGFYKQLFKRRIGARINGIFLKKEVDKCEFKCSKIFFASPENLRDLKKRLQDVCHALTIYHRSDTVPEPEGIFNDSCSTTYSRCEFYNACAAVKPEIYNAIIGNMKSIEYNPLSFRK